MGEYEPEPTSTSSVDDRLGTDRTLDALETGAMLEAPLLGFCVN